MKHPQTNRQEEHQGRGTGGRHPPASGPPGRDQRGHAERDRNRAQRSFAEPEQQRGEALGREPPKRRGLPEPQRTSQFDQRTSTDVKRDHFLVEPQRRADQPIPKPQANPADEEPHGQRTKGTSCTGTGVAPECCAVRRPRQPDSPSPGSDRKPQRIPDRVRRQATECQLNGEPAGRRDDGRRFLPRVPTDRGTPDGHGVSGRSSCVVNRSSSRKARTLL